MTRKALAVKILVYGTFLITVLAVLFLLGYRMRHPANSEAKFASYQEKPVTKDAYTPQAKTEPYRQESQCGDSYTCKLTEPITLLTALLVIGVGITNYIYYGQLKKMRETVAIIGQQRDAMKDQLTAMQRQVTEMGEQTKLAAKVAEATLIAERAYIGVYEAKLTALPTGGRASGYMILKNGGKTPAWNVETQYVLTFGKEPVRFQWNAALERPHEPSFAIAGEPKTIFIQDIDRVLSESDLWHLQNKKVFYFLFAETRYEDYAGNLQIVSFGGEFDKDTNTFKEHYQHHRSANPN